jgi:hypothetical protein
MYLHATTHLRDVEMGERRSPIKEGHGRRDCFGEARVAARPVGSVLQRRAMLRAGDASGISVRLARGPARGGRLWWVVL